MKDEGGSKRLEQVQTDAKIGDGAFGPPKAPRGGGSAPRSSRNEYMRSGLYSTFTIQSLQTPSPAGRLSRQETELIPVLPAATIPEPPPPTLTPVEDIPQLHISTEEPESQEPLQVSHQRSFCGLVNVFGACLGSSAKNCIPLRLAGCQRERQRRAKLTNMYSSLCIKQTALSGMVIPESKADYLCKFICV